MTDSRPVLTLGHSPDPDDAFMWWPLVGLDGGPPPLDTGRFRYETVHDDIERLNARAETGELAITAMSCAQYPRVHDRYAITACGSSMGDRYGPKLVARTPTAVAALRGTRPRVAVPGVRTSAFAALSIMLGRDAFEAVPMPFDQIIEAVVDGACDLGVVIHEGQLTFDRADLHLVEDLGAWWGRETGLPLPLGINTVRRDLDDAHGAGTLAEVTATLLRSVEHAMAHRATSIEYAMGFARGIERETVDRFVEMYVNQWTLDFGPIGREAVERFLGEMGRCGLIEPIADVGFVAPLASAGP